VAIVLMVLFLKDVGASKRGASKTLGVRPANGGGRVVSRAVVIGGGRPITRVVGTRVVGLRVAGLGVVGLGVAGDAAKSAVIGALRGVPRNR
jgi:hypothetical protein